MVVALVIGALNQFDCSLGGRHLRLFRMCWLAAGLAIGLCSFVLLHLLTH